MPVKLSALTKKADRVFSEYIRKRDTTTYIQDGEGMSISAGMCITCQRVVPTQGKGTGHAGHFIERGCKLTRFDPRNVHLQCVSCNTYKSGEQWKHGRAIERLYGEAVVKELEELEAKYKRNGHKFTREELESVIQLFS